jgi:Tol biopolymer transport system component
MAKKDFQLRKKFGYFLGTMLVIVCFFAGCATRTADIISYDSATLQNVVRVTDNKLRKDAVRVSPDGSKILYCEAAISDVDAWLSFDQFSVMLLRDANLSAKTPIVSDASFGPVWYDDNVGFIYAVYEGGSSKLVKSNITGGGKTYVTRNSIGEFDTRPSIKGHNILCETRINGVQHIVNVKDDGSEVTILGEGNSPSWHPNPKENKFVFIKNGSICEMNLINYQVTQIYSAATDKNRNIIEFCRQPSYSKDGKYILFAKGANTFITATTKTFLGGFKALFTRTRVETERQHLFLINSDGTGLSRLTSGNVDVFSPSWGINDEIFFVANVQNATEIWKARLLLISK